MTRMLSVSINYSVRELIVMTPSITVHQFELRREKNSEA